MLLVPTYIAASSIEGLGVFAAAPIAAGASVWRHDPLFDVVVPDLLIAGYPPAARAFLKKYAYRQAGTRGYRLLDSDNGRFMNHSVAANTDNRGAESLARRAIAAGEEITCDYREFIANFDPAEFERS